MVSARTNFPPWKWRLLPHAYADDTQILGVCRPTETEELQRRVSDCLAAVSSWMAANRLQLNHDKAEALWPTRQPCLCRQRVALPWAIVRSQWLLHVHEMHYHDTSGTLLLSLPSDGNWSQFCSGCRSLPPDSTLWLTTAWTVCCVTTWWQWALKGWIIALVYVVCTTIGPMNTQH